MKLALMATLPRHVVLNLVPGRCYGSASVSGLHVDKRGELPELFAS